MDIQIVKQIRNNGKTLFQFPINTLLDNILPELWPNILSYNNNAYIIGKHNENYCGYKKIIKKIDEDPKIIIRINSKLPLALDIDLNKLASLWVSVVEYPDTSIWGFKINNELIREDYPIKNTYVTMIDEFFDRGLKILHIKEPIFLSLFVRDKQNW